MPTHARIKSSCWALKADSFDVDENGYLVVRANDGVVARFSPAAWHAVLDNEAVSE